MCPLARPAVLYFQLLGFGAADSKVVLDDVIFIFRPVAAGDQGATDEARALTVSAANGLLVNDRPGTGGGALQVTSFDAISSLGAVVSVSPNGSFRYDPTGSALLNRLSADVTTVDTFGYTITDGVASSTSIVSITVTGVNDIPVLVNPGNQSLNERSPISFSLSATDVDRVGDQPEPLTFSVISGGQAGMFLDPTSGAFSWTPSETQDGQRVVIFRAKDTHNAASDQTVTFTVNELNDPPLLTNPGDKSLADLQQLKFTLAATDGDRVNGVADSITYSIASGLQTGMTLDPTTGAFEWTPSATQSGQFVVKFRATDIHSATSDQSITITVQESNHAPTAINISNANAKENISELTLGTLSAVDQDAGQTHQFSTTDSRFEIVGNALKLKVGEFLDFGQGATTNVTITARDSGATPQSLTQAVVINVAANPFPWQFATQKHDTNADGTVVPLDALRVINLLNDPSILQPGGKLPRSPHPATSTLPFYDVNGDGFCTPNDVLRVINFLNGAVGEGEGNSNSGSSNEGWVVATADGYRSRRIRVTDHQHAEWVWRGDKSTGGDGN